MGLASLPILLLHLYVALLRGLQTLVTLGQGAEHSLTALAARGPQQLPGHPKEVPTGLLIRLDYLHNPLHPKAPHLILNEERRHLLTLGHNRETWNTNALLFFPKVT